MPEVMFSFPDKLVMRMKAVIPARERSKVADLLENEIKAREQHPIFSIVNCKFTYCVISAKFVIPAQAGTHLQNYFVAY